MANTPRRSVRVPDDLWSEALSSAEQRGESVSDVLVRALRSYVLLNSTSDPSTNGPDQRGKR